jgi:hypothetical protein
VIPVLSWQSEDNNTKRARKRPLTWHLFAGPVLVATLYPSASGARHQPYFEIPHIKRQPWRPLLEAQTAAESAVSAWFESCFSPTL